MGILNRIAEEKIRAAIESGEWNNLPGKRQPVKVDDNPHEPPGMSTAYHVLHENGFSLPWIEEHKEIEADLTAGRRRGRQAWAQAGTSAEREAAASGHLAWIEAANRRIFHYNLQAPSPQFHMALLDPQREAAALQNEGEFRGESG